ncbi:hypothetical protein BGZ70_004995 [Mortierella alpina]|uniref:Galactose oxidase n=1 Tax=Mortierella alpina TaxID=64518 RepID=A0A9P6M4K8_MORAP|nr:hypothetical protein BGZ70_004995 [Mortierella alpina]
MLLSLCRRCNRRLLQASSRLRQLRQDKALFHGASPSRSFHSAGSTVIGKTLYVVSGTGTGRLPQSYVAITDVLSLALDQPFSTDSAPWVSLKPGPAVADARIVPSADPNRLILGGMGEAGTPLIRVYDIQADTWSPLPPQPISGNVASPRTSVGIALDSGTGAVIVFGGLVPNTAFSRELDVLDTRPTFSDWAWTLVAPASSFIQLAPLYQPIVLYVPQLQSTLLMGGCDTYSARTVVVSCQTFDSAFQIKTTVTSENMATSPPVKFKLTSRKNILPVPRSSSCYVVLANGDVFMYGGLADATTLSDAWVLSIQSWEWTPITINNAPPAGRAGATCQLIAHNQVIVLGGYSGANAASKVFSQPQIGVIDTDSWSWGQDYTPSTASGGLSLGVIIGIVAGSCLMLGVVLFIVGSHLWTKRKARSAEEEKRVSHSNIPLMDDSVNNSSNSLHTRQPRVVVSTLKFANQSSSGSSSPVSGTWSTKDSRSLPLIITPYSPTTTSFSTSTFADVSLDTPTSKSSRGNNKRNKGAYNNEIHLPESERLPETMADNQYGHYFKTIQHHKQYEKRLTGIQQQQQQRQSSLGRSDTSTQYTMVHKDDVEDHPYFATGMIDLKEIELGEESIMIPMQPLETGTILVSGYVDPSSFYRSSSEPVPAIPSSFSQASTVGVSQPWTFGQDASLHGKSEALSSESVQSEVRLEDYRRRT